VRFVDTNVLLYAISRDPAEQDKAKRANDILAERDLALSVQVLQVRTVIGRGVYVVPQDRA